MKIKRIALVFVVIFILLVTNVYAENSIKYFLGYIDEIIAGDTTVSYYSDNQIERIETKGATISLNRNGTLDLVEVDSGSIDFFLGKIDTLKGNYADICHDVRAALQNALIEVTDYISSINIKVPGAATPDDSVQVVTDSFNEIITQLNQATLSSNASISDNGTSVSANNGTSTTTNLNGISSVALSVGESTDNYDGNETDGLDTALGVLDAISGLVSVDVDSNGANVNVGGANGVSISSSDGVNIGGSNGISVDSNGVKIGGASISSDGISLDTTGATVTVNGQEVQTSNNNTTLYILIGAGFAVLFLGMVFGFIIIKKKQGNIVTKE